MTAYLCDGLGKCSNNLGCYRCGGDCRHTLDKKHALLGGCGDPENHPERFRPVDAHGSETYYWELEG